MTVYMVYSRKGKEIHVLTNDRTVANYTYEILMNKMGIQCEIETLPGYSKMYLECLGKSGLTRPVYEPVVRCGWDKCTQEEWRKILDGALLPNECKNILKEKQA